MYNYTDFLNTDSVEDILIMNKNGMKELLYWHRIKVQLQGQ